jgi:hypothetical protein
MRVAAGGLQTLQSERAAGRTGRPRFRSSASRHLLDLAAFSRPPDRATRRDIPSDALEAWPAHRSIPAEIGACPRCAVLRSAASRAEADFPQHSSQESGCAVRASAASFRAARESTRHAERSSSRILLLRGGRRRLGGELGDDRVVDVGVLAGSARFLIPAVCVNTRPRVRARRRIVAISVSPRIERQRAARYQGISLRVGHDELVQAARIAATVPLRVELDCDPDLAQITLDLRAPSVRGPLQDPRQERSDQDAARGDRDARRDRDDPSRARGESPR